MTATFYMVEMDYPAETRESRAAYDGFYDRHIGMLLGIDGFLSAQRFECVHAARAPFLAVYGLRDAAVMTSEAYVSTAGRLSVPEEFRNRMANWDRNLVAADEGALGAAGGLPVPADGTLVLVDRMTDAAPPLPDGFCPLAVIGLDRTIAERGLRTGDDSAVETDDGWTVRTFRALGAARTA